MDWFTSLWLTALAVALISGKAYFRGVVDRRAEPKDYWIVCACYLVLAGLMPVITLLKR